MAPRELTGQRFIWTCWAMLHLDLRTMLDANHILDASLVTSHRSKNDDSDSGHRSGILLPRMVVRCITNSGNERTEAWHHPGLMSLDSRPR